jgi:hypothetical protein
MQRDSLEQGLRESFTSGSFLILIREQAELQSLEAELLESFSSHMAEVFSQVTCLSAGSSLCLRL